MLHVLIIFSTTYSVLQSHKLVYKGTRLCKYLRTVLQIPEAWGSLGFIGRHLIGRGRSLWWVGTCLIGRRQSLWWLCRHLIRRRWSLWLMSRHLISLLGACHENRGYWSNRLCSSCHSGCRTCKATAAKNTKDDDGDTHKSTKWPSNCGSNNWKRMMIITLWQYNR